MYAIRLAMLGGVLMFGAVSWVLHRTPGWAPPAGVNLDALATVARVLWALVVGGCAFLWFRARSADAAGASSLAIAAWALGEVVALFGGVVYFLTGIAWWYLAGVVFLALAFTAFPARRLG